MRNGARIGSIKLKGTDCTVVRPREFGNQIPRATKVMDKREASVRSMVDAIVCAEPRIKYMVSVIGYDDGEVSVYSTLINPEQAAVAHMLTQANYDNIAKITGEGHVD